MSEREASTSKLAHAGGGHVRVLSTRARGAARAQRDLAQRDAHAREATGIGSSMGARYSARAGLYSARRMPLTEQEWWAAKASAAAEEPPGFPFLDEVVLPAARRRE